MELAALLTLATLAAVIGLLVFSRLAPDVILAGSLAFLLVTGVLTPAQGLAGFSNPGLMTVAVLYLVSAGLKETGAVYWLTHKLLGSPRSERLALVRMILPTSLLSAFMNNTAVVAMFMPGIQAWAQRLRIPASKLLMPLSYMTILGGLCTLIGTSTNLVVDGLLQSELGLHLGMFELAWIGVPLVAAGGLYLAWAAPYLLPDHGSIDEALERLREYGVEMEVEERGPIAGKSITEAGLRSLSFGYLAEIDRGGRLLTAVEPTHILFPGDKLYFVGAPECATELRRIQGLRPTSGNPHKLNLGSHQRCLVEVVLGQEFPFLDMSVRESRFRTRFNAVILSVSRQGRRVPGKVGDIEFRPGDTLLLEASIEFVEQYRFRRDFLLVSALNDSTPPNFEKAGYSLLILAGMVGVSASGMLDILEAAMLAAAAMIATGCLTVSRARLSIDLPVLVVIAASSALGSAMDSSGLASLLAGSLLDSVALTPWQALVTIYILTALLTETVTNNAAAVLMFPIAVAVADSLQVTPLPYAIAVAIGASASFLTPLGYQTNLMVLGPGGYRTRDFLKLGLPMSIICATLVALLVPVVWPLVPA